MKKEYYLQPTIELSDDIYSHQINKDKILNIINKLPYSKYKIEMKQKYYANELIMEYINQKEMQIKKEKIKKLELIDGFIYVEKKIKEYKLEDYDITELDYIETSIELQINNFNFIFIYLDKESILNIKTLDDIKLNIDNFSSISFKYNLKEEIKEFNKLERFYILQLQDLI